ncbi:DegT/DnrJ/EryC1/StrS family aminotransferase [Paraneptunicella aestuarii]|uniref:DegT/DnrJ/EryC1/StrS family aminotransferase n=1 Tax=Paraneptunicella aestuarii TaxID=2831148 RepID=UPI001E4D3F15|nr:DegT/DnrJ/EryC1/StrS family aminotransferase [Paraneptunicella aestuarii]UAA39647.1 DegT/DnrJ/EryC1/StrS family aminotransferase [Paraneptunicella aestuarii]
MQFIDLKAQYSLHKDRVDARIHKVLEHGNFILGPEVKELEEKLAQYCGVKHCLGVANGTDALQLSLMALGIKPGDYVLTTTFSFFATAEVISLVGAIPVFVDICPQTYNLSSESLKAAISHLNKSGIQAKAIIAVDLFGLPVDYREIKQIADENNLYVIEDAAQGFGGSIDGHRSCSFGDISTTSFFPAKPLGCYGDGGAVFTNNDELASLIGSLRVHGKGTDKYDNVRIGLNSRLDTIQAAVLLEKLAIFDKELEAKQRLAQRYSDGLNNRFVVPHIPEGMTSSWAQYCIIPKSGHREQFMARLKDASIPTAVYYEKPLHLQTVYKEMTHVVNLEHSERVAQLIFSLPMHPYVANEECDQIVSILNGV